MATATVRQVIEVAPMKQNIDCLEEERQRIKDEKIWQDRLSVLSFSSSRTYPCRNESQSPMSTYNPLFYSNSRPNSGNTGYKTDTNTALNLKVPIIRKSRFDMYSPGNYPLRQRQQSNATIPRENKTDGALHSIEMQGNSNVDPYFQNNTEFPTDSCKVPKHLSRKSCFCVEKSDDKQNQHRNNDTPMADIEILSQKSNPPDFEEVNKFTLTRHQNKSQSLSPRQPGSFEASQLALKLRGSLQSNFLSNELRQWDIGQFDEKTFGTSEAIQTIDLILKYYGITDDVIPAKLESNDDRTEKSQYDAENCNISQNNEAFDVLVVANKQGNNDQSSSQPQQAEITTSAPMGRNSTTPSVKAIAPCSATSLKTNVSQNNETTAKCDNAGCDMVRKYGSSVDYSVTGAGGKYSVGSKLNFGRYDYGKATIFSGDNAPASTTNYPITEPRSMDCMMSESKAMSIKVAGSQVDVNEEVGYDRHRNMSSPTDSLEFTISNERQRLKKINALITATSVSTPQLPMARSFATRFMPPMRGYSKIRTSDKLAKMLSSPTFPSSSYNVGPQYKSIFVPRSSHQDTSVFLWKSASAPGKWGASYQAPSTYVPEPRTTYVPYLSTTSYNTQYNNSAYSSRLFDTFPSQNNFNKNNQKAASNKQQNCLLKSNCQKVPLICTTQKYSNHSQCLQQNVSNTTISSSRCQRQRVLTPRPNSVWPKRNAKGNINDSKSAYSQYGGFDFVKNTNLAFGKSLAEKPVQDRTNSKNVSKKRKEPRHKSKKETFVTMAQELFNKSNMQPSGRASVNSRKTTCTEVIPSRSPGLDSQVGHTSRNSCGRCSRESQHTVPDKTKKTFTSLEKKKFRLEPSFLMYQASLVPKSILKHVTTAKACALFGTSRSRCTFPYLEQGSK